MLSFEKPGFNQVNKDPCKIHGEEVTQEKNGEGGGIVQNTI